MNQLFCVDCQTKARTDPETRREMALLIMSPNLWVDNGGCQLCCYPCKLEAENKELKEDIAEKQSLFDLQHTRTLEASAAWQAETGKDCFPDLGKLVGWLMEKAGRNKQLVDALVSINKLSIRDDEAMRSMKVNAIASKALNETDFANIQEGKES